MLKLLVQKDQSLKTTPNLTLTKTHRKDPQMVCGAQTLFSTLTATQVNSQIQYTSCECEPLRHRANTDRGKLETGNSRVKSRPSNLSIHQLTNQLTI